MFGQILLLLNAIACALLVWQGEKEERMAVVMIVAATLAEMFVSHLVIGSWHYGVALTNLALFAGLWALNERFDRWWLFMSAGVELLIALAYLLPLVSSAFQSWTLATIQLGLWSLVSLFLFFGVLEVRLARQLRLWEAVDDIERDR